jgi:uncharacterized damage-inducible protein DinB
MTTPTIEARPSRGEAAEYYFTYIDKVPSGDIRELLERQLDETTALLSGISEERSRYRYAPDKWSIRQLASHIADTERVFAFRAFWFARELGSELPSFDQNDAIARADGDERTLASHLEEFRAVRSATIALFRNLPDEAWARRGVASGNPVTVRALAYIAAGHVEHHLGILRERYLPR